jgi:hypothetical protein
MTPELAAALAALVVAFPSLPVFYGWSLRDLSRTSTGLDNVPPFAVWGDLAETARRLRALLGQDADPGAVLTSAYRAPAVNAAVGGVSGSRHQAGRAVDLAGQPASLVLLADKARARGLFSEVLVHDGGSGSHLHLGWGAPFKRS